MMRRVLGIVLIGMVCNAAFADTLIFFEDFESYADDSELFGQWGSGNGSNFRLADASIEPNAFPEGGKGAEHLGGPVAEWIGLNTGNALHPSATQNIVIQGDLYDTGSGNKRISIGLRGAGANLVELGQYNSNSCDPTVCGPNQAGGTSNPQNAVVGDPGFYDGTGYGARLQLFQSINPPLLVQPDWQYFELPIELDRQIGENPPNGIVNIADIGAGWHQYTATITPDSITLEIDLFRDGLRNTSRIPDEITGIRPGSPGVDASMTFPVVTSSAGYSSLRIGGPSGVTSAGGSMIFDNIMLSLVDVTEPGNTPDFNGDSIVDAADYTIWRDNLGLMGGATQATGDANGDFNVDSSDYDLWKAAFGTMPGSASLASAAVPEPSAGALMLFGLAFSALVGRSRE